MFFKGIINGYEKTTVVKKTAATAAKKAVKSVASKVTEAAVAATAAGRKALLQKVKDEVAAGRVNVSDKSAVEQDILKGEPTDASSKMQFGDIERMLFMA